MRGVLNFRDKAIVDGIYEPQKVPKPLTLASDAAGTVVAVGEGVSRFKVGDRVNSHLYSRWLDGPPGPDEPEYCFGSLQAAKKLGAVAGVNYKTHPPVIDKVYSFEDARQAYEHLTKSAFGKVVINVS